MSLTPIAVRPSRTDRLLAAVDRVRHPHLTHELARATNGFRSNGVIRHYENSVAGRRLEALEGGILWHRGYRPPTRITHNAMWWTGGPRVEIAYNRELVPAWMSERTRRISEELGLTRR